MPRVTTDETLDHTKPYRFHGIDLSWKDGDKDAMADCPFCGRPDKFSVEVKTSKAQCLKCTKGCNSRQFIQWLWKQSDDAQYVTDGYKELASERGLLYTETLMRWGVCSSTLTDNFLVPGYGVTKKLNQLYKWMNIKDRMCLLPTPTLGHAIHGMSEYSLDKDCVFICEGPWDGMVLWELLNCAKETDDGLSPTSNPSRSILSNSNVIAVPGVTTFPQSWSKPFADKIAILMFDSDHPRKHPKTGKLVAPAGLGGVKRVAGILANSKEPPKEIRYLRWGKDGYDPKQPSGYDLRDALSADNLSDRIKTLEQLLKKIHPVPKSWIKLTDKKHGGGEDLKCVECDSHNKMILAWRKALKWTDGLEYGLDVMLASVVSTRSVGDQLWVKVMGPASCGKTTLCEAISVNKRYVIAKDNIRGFHSGFSTSNPNEDSSLIVEASGKTLVTKDGDTLLNSPNLGQILSEGRALYDGSSRAHYRNKMGKDYVGVRMTWLLCGTSSLKSIDQSELGERFLDCVVMEEIDDELEDEILWRIVNRAERNLSVESNSDAESRHEPELVNAMQLTGGYINYLCEDASVLFESIYTPEGVKRLCTRYAKFVAYMRARPSDKQDELAEREMAGRLTSQHMRLAKCLAAVMNRKEVDSDVMAKVYRVAMDTSRGPILDITKQLYEADGGIEALAISLYLGGDDGKVRKLLRFMKRIGAAESFSVKKKGIRRTGTKWRLTPTLTRLYKKVMVDNA